MSLFRSIKTRLLIFGLSISLIPISIITTLYYFNTRRVLKSHQLQKMTAIAESKKIHTISFIKAKEGRTIDFSSDGFIRDSLETIARKGYQSYAVTNLNKHLKDNKMTLDPQIVAIAIVDLDGRIVSSTNEAVIGKNMSKYEIFNKGIDKNYGETYVGQSYHSPYVNTDCIFISTPLTCKHGGGTIGVIINYYDLDALSEITTNRAGMGETGEVYLVNNSDKIMLTKSRFIEGANLKQVVDTAPIRKIAEHGEEMSGIYADYRGVPIVGASAHIPEYGWTLLAEMDKAEAFAPLRGLSITALLVGGVCGAATICIGIIFSLSTARPINKLKCATERIASGDLKYRVDINSKNEIGSLANSFNTMAGKLNLLNESLEKRIADRTAELAEKNEKLLEEIIERKRVEKELKVLNESLERSVDERTKKLLKKSEKLMSEIITREQAEEQIKASLKEKEVLLKEIHHRVKNNLQIVSSLLDMGSMQTQNQEVIDLIMDCRNRINSMALVHSQLYKDERLNQIDMEKHIQELSKRLLQIYEMEKTITLDIKPTDIYLPITRAVPCALVLNELISNTLKHAYRDGQKGKIDISMQRSDGDTFSIKVKDDGIGIPEEIDINTTNSLGLSLVRNLVFRQLSGKLYIRRNRGTEVVIEFKALKEEIRHEQSDVSRR